MTSCQSRYRLTCTMSATVMETVSLQCAAVTVAGSGWAPSTAARLSGPNMTRPFALSIGQGNGRDSKPVLSLGH